MIRHPIPVTYQAIIDYREEPVSHYLSLAARHDPLVSGGTDFHGDGRVGLADIRLGISEARGIVNRTSSEPA